MSDPFIPNLVNKTTPVGGDLFIIADSQDSNLEKSTSITQVISNNNIITQTGSVTSGHLLVGGGSANAKDSGIAVDTSQNVTGVNSLTLAQDPSSALQASTKQYADLKLSKAGNLSDVQSAQQSFNNIAPSNPSKGDVIYFDGANWVKRGIGQDNYIFVASGGVPTWQPQPATSGFIDNAVFSSAAGLSITSIDLQPINLANMGQFTPGNRWIPSGDSTGMKCLAAGYYLFQGLIGIKVVGSSGFGYVYGQFSLNNAGYGLAPPVYIQTTNTVIYLPVQAIIPCAVNDVVRLGVYRDSSTTSGTYSVLDPSTVAGNASSCSITRLT